MNRIALYFILTLGLAAAEDWKLQPLKYNNPDLQVDLGVGLWAWPMPMDYDGDGDMDLLVSCPDKPSNGVYFFENPTQDPKVKMPVFKPGVRLGPTGHNMQVSFVNGEPRVLQETTELPNFKDGDFETKKKIYPNARFHPGQTRMRAWRYVDYEGDGDHDLIVGVGDWSDYVWDHAYDAQGNWRNGPLHGYVYLIENAGTDEEPDYSDKPTKIETSGGEIDVYGWPSPSFADFDGDGDLDMICGEFLDGFTYFENRGTREEPAYAIGRKLKTRDQQLLTMDLQMITPTAIDWDGDGDQDLIVGDEDGRVALVEHSGQLQDGAPLFLEPAYFQEQADTLKFGALATPFVYDWDYDGDEDILCGNTAGYIGYFENLGPDGSGLPKWQEPRLLLDKPRNFSPTDFTSISDTDASDLATGFEFDRPFAFRILAGPSGSIQGPCEAKWGYTTLSVADWDGDDVPDVLVNGIWGKLQRLKPASLPARLIVSDRDRIHHHVTRAPLKLGDQDSPNWFWWNSSARMPTTQWRTTPLAIDWDGDDSMDLVCLDREGYLTVWRQDQAPERLFINEDNQPFRLTARSAGRSGRFKLAATDWDGDGRMDFLVNSENAVWYRNCEDRDGKIVLKRIGNLAKRNVSGHTSSPAVCDFDKDGKPDLIVGAENGRIYHIKHDDCIQYEDQQLQARPMKPTAAPRFPGLVKEDFVFTKAKFPQCHASSICETTRGLVVAWFGGTREKAADVGIWASYNDGAGWTAPKEWANGVQHSEHRHPCWNPVLYQPPCDAPTLLFFKVGPNPQEWWGEMMVSYDRGRSFRERRRLPETIDGPVRCKPILLPDGKTLLSGSSTEYDGWTVHFEKVQLKDGEPHGEWRRIGPINTKDEFNAIQPTILTHKDGTLQVLCRTRESVVSTSFSKDGGETWSKMEATNLPNPNSGIEVVTLQDGRHLLIYNHLGSGETGWGRRGMLNLAMSEDGKVWKKVAVLEQEEKAEFSYPAIIQAADGLVHMTYTWKRQRIKHVVVDPALLNVSDELSLENWE